MAKQSGSPNYMLADVERLPKLIENALPLGKDDCERLTASFNANRARGAPERDMDSLRRKFKSLYGSRKPSGTAEMPPHIKKAKEVKQAIDDKANVIEMDDEADNDERPLGPDFSLDVDPDESFYEEDGDRVPFVSEVTGHEASARTDESGDGESTASVCSNRGEFQDLLASPLEDFSRTPRPVPPQVESSTRRFGSQTTPNPLADTASPTTQQPTVQGLPAGSRDAIEALKYKNLKNYSNRLGGHALYAFRDTVGVKRAHEEDKDTMEASFAKAKRLRAMKTTTALKTKLTSLETSANTMGGNILETLLLLREENERKAETRRVEEERRRRDDHAAMEARRLAEKAEAEEHRRQERLEMEDRARRDREEARSRTQELFMLIGALTKKD